MDHGHVSFQMNLLYEQIATYFASELSSFISTFVFAMSVHVAFVSIHSSAFIKTFVSEFIVVVVKRPVSFTKIDCKIKY